MLSNERPWAGSVFGCRKERGRKIAIAGEAVFIVEAQILCGPFRLVLQGLVLGLRQIDDLGVVAEYHFFQFGVFVELQGLDDESFELPRDQIGQVEGGELVLSDFRECLVAAEEGVTMWSANAFDMFFFADPVELAARAAFGITNENTAVAFRRALAIASRIAGAILSG